MSSLNYDGIFSDRLEAMITAALQDGVLTDKERELLKRRVEKEGEDWDEVEMIIEARMAEMFDDIKSKSELIADVVAMLEGRTQGVISALESGPQISQVEYNSEKTSSIVDQESNDDIDGDGYYVQNGERFIISTSTDVIKEREFAEKENIEKVVFPSSIVKIENFAFICCSHLVDIDFSKCLKLKEIGESAFQDCGLKSVDLSRCTSLKTIGETAFWGCKRLTNIIFPNNLCDLGCLAFGKNEKLSQIDLSSTNIKELNDLFGTTGQYNSFFWGTASDMKNLKHISFPPSIREIPEKMCFGLKMLESIDLSKCTHLKHICEAAFAITPNLKEVLLPDSVEVMEKWAFSKCGNIKYFNIPASLKEMGYGVFQQSEIESIDFSKVTRLSTIPEATFGECKILKHISFPASIQEIPKEMCFKLEMLESVDLSKCTHLKHICESAFAVTPNLKEVLLPDSIEVMEKWAFAECGNIKYFNVPASLKEMGYGVFAASEIEFMDFSKVTRLSTIPEATFGQCKKLKHVILPASLKEMGFGVFAEGTGLINLDFSKVSLLKVIPERFLECDSIKTLTIPNGVKEIKDGAFSVSNMEEMFLPPSLEHFGTFGHYDMILYCFAPQLDELESLVEDLEKDNQLMLYVLPQHLDAYIEQRDAEGVSINNLSILPMPDEYIYYYDN